MTGDFLLAGVSALALTVGIVAGLRKAFKLSREQTVLVAFVVGQLLAIGGYVVLRFPEYKPLLDAVISGIILWLAASGIWSSQKAVREDRDA